MKKRILYKLNSFIISLIFGLAIFIPFYIGIFEIDKEISKIEKRKLSQIPKMPKTIAEVKIFPKLFDTYYSDQFGLRDWFTKYYKLVKYNLGDSPSSDVTIGKNGWLFLGSIKKGYNKYRDPIGDVRNVNLYSQKALKEFAKYMTGLKSWLNDKDIEYIFVIAPNKHTVYFDELPDYISKVNEYSATDQLVGYLKEYTDVPVIDLRSKLINEKDIINEFNNSLNKIIFNSSDKFIFSNNWKKLKFYQLINNKDNFINLIAIGTDPQITFPPLPFKSNNKYILHIAITSSVKSTLQVFYSDSSKSGYPFSAKNLVQMAINKGDNDVYILLNYPNIGKYLRLDPITRLGEVTIKTLEIKEVQYYD